VIGLSITSLANDEIDSILYGCHRIELEGRDIDHSIDEMKRVGAVLLTSSDL
jgi:hypothetical protein